MFCTKCGKTVPDDALFCASCGTQLRTAIETRTPIHHFTGPPPAPRTPALNQFVSIGIGIAILASILSAFACLAGAGSQLFGVGGIAGFIVAVRANRHWQAAGNHAAAGDWPSAQLAQATAGQLVLVALASAVGSQMLAYAVFGR